jgi:transposase-like protein
MAAPIRCPRCKKKTGLMAGLTKDRYIKHKCSACRNTWSDGKALNAEETSNAE